LVEIDSGGASMLKVFISYSHADEAFRKELDAHLSPFVRNRSLKMWHDRKLLAGTPVDSAIMEKLETSDVFLALISPNFIDSDYCFELEFARARERHDEGTMNLVPVILRACQWQKVPLLAGLLATPKDGKPVTSWPNKDEAWNDVADQIGRLVAASQNGQSASVPKTSLLQNVPLEHKATETSARGLGLKLPKAPPSDRDKDKFRLASFEAIYGIFEKSLSEAEHQESVEGQIRRLDANRFCAVLYLDGRKVSAVTIYISSSGFGGNGINFVNQEDADTNASNGWFSVADHEGALHFGSNAMFGGGGRDRQLAASDVAEEIWNSFIAPLQNQRRRATRGF
jgi:TIR domain